MNSQFFNHQQAERGGAFVYVSVILVGLVLLVGLVIDSATLYHRRTQLQSVLDSAALTSAFEISLYNRKTVKELAYDEIKVGVEVRGLEFDINNFGVLPVPADSPWPVGVEVWGSVPVDLFLLDIFSGFGETMEVAARAKAQRPVNIFGLVLDTSSSMTEKMDDLRAAALNVLERVNPSFGDRVVLVEYNYADESQILHDLGDYPSPEALQSAVAELRDRGSTCIGCGLQLATSSLLTYEPPSEVPFVNKFILLMTDGFASSIMAGEPASWPESEGVWDPVTCGWTIDSADLVTTPLGGHRVDRRSFAFALAEANRAKVHGIPIHAVALGTHPEYPDPDDASPILCSNLHHALGYDGPDYTFPLGVDCSLPIDWPNPDGSGETWNQCASGLGWMGPGFPFYSDPCYYCAEPNLYNAGPRSRCGGTFEETSLHQIANDIDFLEFDDEGRLIEDMLYPVKIAADGTPSSSYVDFPTYTECGSRVTNDDNCGCLPRVGEDYP